MPPLEVWPSRRRARLACAARSRAGRPSAPRAGPAFWQARRARPAHRPGAEGAAPATAGAGNRHRLPAAHQRRHRPPPRGRQSCASWASPRAARAGGPDPRARPAARRVAPGAPVLLPVVSLSGREREVLSLARPARPTRLRCRPPGVERAHRAPPRLQHPAQARRGHPGEAVARALDLPAAPAPPADATGGPRRPGRGRRIVRTGDAPAIAPPLQWSAPGAPPSGPAGQDRGRPRGPLRPRTTDGGPHASLGHAGPAARRGAPASGLRGGGDHAEHGRRAGGNDTPSAQLHRARPADGQGAGAAPGRPPGGAWWASTSSSSGIGFDQRVLALLADTGLTAGGLLCCPLTWA